MFRFKKNFRLDKFAFLYVLEQLSSELTPTRKSFGITAQAKLCVFLRFVAEGSYQHGVGQDYGISLAQSSVSECISQVLDILEKKLCPVWIQLNMSEAEKEAAKKKFYEQSRLPGVILCVDGTHIKILPPSEDKHLFINRKGFYSLNTLIACDHKMRIRCVDARYPGSNHDSHVWNLSDARQHFEQQHQQGVRNSFILGDAGYPLEPWLITPFRSPEQFSCESNFNKAHAKARNIVERTIGLLKNRFRCLLGARQLHYSPKKAVQFVNVCCALHNICIYFNVEDDEYLVQQHPGYDDDNYDETVENSNSQTEAQRIRATLMDSLSI